MDNDHTTTMYFLSKQHVYLHRGINQDNFSKVMLDQPTNPSYYAWGAGE